MAKFILTKVPDKDCRGAEVTYIFESEHLPHAQDHIRTFLEASGFVFPEEEQEDTFEFRVTNEDFVAKEEDWLWDEADTFINKETDVHWNEAFVAKFGAAAASEVINGGQGADIISFNDYTLGGK